MSLLCWIALVDLVAVVALTVRKVDVRLVLLLGAVPLFAAMGGPGMVEMLAKVVAEMTNPATVVPIGSAMGFAYVLRLTGCDREMVRLMLRPLRYAPALLVPGGVAAGYLVNTTIVSQSGTAAVLGPILIPLLRAGGMEAATAGAVLLLGASMGGELFNPGAVEMRKLSELTGLEGHVVVSRQAPLNFAACGAALLSFWFMTQRRARTVEDGSEEEEPAESAEDRPINFFKAMVPVAPLAILFVDAALGASSPLAAFEGPSKILAAMLAGLLLAWAAVPSSGGRLAPIASVMIPWGLGVVSGSGIAPAVSIMEFFVPAADSLGLDPVRIGALASLGAHFGRTMSPAAAVVAVCARLTGEPGPRLIRRVVVPLLIGMAVMIAATVLRLI